MTTPSSPKNLLRDAALLFLALLLAGLWNLEGPEFWWDEGWTLSVARNYVERGLYVRLLDGEPIGAGLAASQLVTLPTAFMMRIFGVGLWQGRLFNVICAAATISLLFLLATRLYDRRVAWATVTALLLAAQSQLNPLLIGRQALGEMPMLLFLIGGYLCLSLALRRRAIWILPAALLWSMALLAKAQTLPFWAVSMLATSATAMLLRRWRALALIDIGAALAYVARPWALQLASLPIVGRTMAGDQISGLYEVTAFVPQASNRFFALQILLIAGIPLMLGLGYAAWRIIRDMAALAFGRRVTGVTADDTIAAAMLAIERMALLSLAGSWLAWYALLSVGVPRYLFPAMFAGSVFVAVLLRDLTGDFRMTAVVERLVAPLRARRLTRRDAGAWLATLLLAITLPLAILSYQRYYFANDQDATRAAEYLNNATPPDALIETYESELHFLLNRRYHYPPDQVHVELNRRSLLGQETPIDYDPLTADPDYLAVGRFASGNHLYDAALATGQFREIFRSGRYIVYQRVR